MFKKYLLLILTLILGMTAQAALADIPANLAKHPTLETLYVIDNTALKLKVYSRVTDNGWQEVPAEAESFLSASKGRGLAVNGSDLYVSISKGSTSEVRHYSLDTSGYPTTYSIMTGAYWATTSVPAGVAVGGNNRLFVADNTFGRFLVYNTSGAFIKNVTDHLAGKAGMFGIVATSTTANTYKIYVSRNVAAGEVYVFNYDSNNDTITYSNTITGLVNPTYMKVVDNKLYVAVNGTDGIGVKVYSTSDELPVGSVSHGVTGSYGWTAFDIATGKLVIKKATNAAETTNKLFQITLSSIHGGNTVTAQEIVLNPPVAINRADGLVLNNNATWAALALSINGSYQQVSLISGETTNHDPQITMNSLKQYEPDGTIPIGTGETTHNDNIIVKFIVTDIDADKLTPTVRCGTSGSAYANWPKIVSAVSYESGTEVSMRVPAADGLANGNYDWQAMVTDEHGAESGWYDLGDGANNHDFVVDTTNDAPATFNKTAPADGAQSVQPRLEWQAAIDPDGDTVTYHVTVYEANGTTVYATADTTTTSFDVPTPGLITGNSYKWQVQADDGYGGLVWANGSQSSQWTFTYIEGIIKPEAPTVDLTAPINAATNVFIDAPIVITFSESMNKTSVESALQIAPAVTNPHYSWNAVQTVLTVTHDNFGTNTPYAVTVGGSDLSSPSQALVAGAVPNPFSFTTGTGSNPTDPITTINITREGDTPGSNVVITWITDPAVLGIDIYKLTRTADVNGNYSAYFTTEASQWTLAQANVTIGTYTVPNQVGAGTAEYYKLIPTGTTLLNSDLTTEVVGKFDIAVGPAETEPAKFFISSPLELASNSLIAVLGGQVSEMDMLLVFDIDKNVAAGSMYSGGAWVAFPGVPVTVDAVEAGMTYGYITANSRYITLVGRVRETNLSRSLTGGNPLVANWIANPYPAPAAIANAGLNNSSNSAIDPTQAGTAYYFDANADLIDGTNGMAFHTGATEWKDGTLQSNSPLQILPGKGYMFTEPVQNSITWDISRPN